MLIVLVVILVILNVTYIIFDLIIFIRLLFYRYGMMVKQNLRFLKIDSDKKVKMQVKHHNTAKVSPEKILLDSQKIPCEEIKVVLE